MFMMLLGDVAMFMMFITVNVQNQLVMKVSQAKLEGELSKDQVIIAVKRNNLTYLDMYSIITTKQQI